MTGETKIYIWQKTDNRFYVVLQNPDGSEEISDQGWASRKECEAAIEEYAKEHDLEIRRTQ